MIFRPLLAFLLIINISNVTHAQSWDYVNGNHKSTNLEWGNSIAVDSTNNFIYVCGSFEDNAALGVPLAQMNAGSGNGSLDGFLAKYDFAGNLIWVTNMGGSNDDEALGVCVDPTGNAYVTGYMKTNGSFYSTNATSVIIPLVQNEDMFVAKFNAAGILQWYRVGGGNNGDYGHTIGWHSTGVFVAGTYKNSASFGTLNTEITFNSKDNTFLVKYNPNTGNEIWLMEVKSDGDDYNSGFSFQESSMDLCVYNDSVYVIGYMGGNILRVTNTSGSLSILPLITDLDGSQNLFIYSVTVNGNLNWIQLVDNISGSQQLGAGITADCDGVYICGSSHDGAVFPGPDILNPFIHDKAFIAKLDKDTGNEIWLKQWNDNGSHDKYFKDIHADQHGYIYAIGTFKSAPFTNTDTSFAVSSDKNMMLFKYRNNGNFMWGERSTGVSDDMGYSVATYKNELLFATGEYSDNFTISTQTVPVTAFDRNIFLARRTLELNNNPCCPIPDISCQNDTSVFVGAGLCGRNMTLNPPSILSSCAITFINNFNGTNNASGFYPVGSTRVLWTGTDLNGERDTCSFLVRVIDNINPSITCPASQTGNVNAFCQFPLLNYTGLAVKSDNCGVPVVTQSPVAGTNVGVGTTVVTLTATDVNGNTSTCNFNVVVSDITPPNITCPAAQTGNVNASCQFALVNYIGLSSATDNCSIASVTQSPVAGTLVGVGTTVVTLTATDINGNTSTCNFNVVVTDVTPPSITCPAAQTGNVNASCQFALLNYTGLATSTDNCSIASVTQSPVAGTLVGVGTTVVTLTATDINGNTSTCNFNVVVTDIIPPTITCPAAQIGNVNAFCQFALLNYTGLAVKSDNCGVPVVTQSPVAGTNVGVGTTVVTLTATDASGNTSTCNFNVVVTDITPPSITCPAVQTGNVNASCQFALLNYTGLATSTDNCSIASVTQSPVAGTNVGVGTTVVTLTATDINGNTSTCNFNVVVTDIIPPTITCPAAQTGNVNASCQFALLNYTGLALKSDNCGVPVVTQSPVAGTLVGVGTTVVTLTATDVNGNTSTCNFNVVVSDIILPSITCPAAQTGNVNASCQFALLNYTGLATATDNCSIASVIQSPITGTLVGVGTTVVTLTATDVNGNTSTCNFNVVVTDITPPNITCPAAQTGNVNASCQFSLLNYTGLATANDNCSIASITQSPASGTNVGVGTTVVTLTATDVNGNTSTCNFNVVVTDVTPPSITCPVAQTGNVNASCQFALLNYTSLATTSDNCGVLSVTQSPAAGTNVGVGTTVVTLTATDVNGNTSTCNFNLVVTDITPPSITCPAPQTEFGNAFCQGTLSNYLSLATTNDNCGVATITQSPVSGTLFSGTQTVTLVVTDINGLMDSCSFIVSVVDNTIPAITCPSNMVQSNDGGVCSAVVIGIAPVTSGDNCSVASITYNLSGATTTSGTNDASGETFNLGITTVTYTITDATGNSSNCSFDVTIIDTENPLISCPSNIAQVNDTGNCSANVNGIAPISSNDNCSVASITYNLSGATIASGINDASGETFNLGLTTVTYTITDAAGNSSNCSFDVTISDTENPIITCPSNITQVNDAGNCSAIVNGILPVSSSDNCSVASITYNLSGATTASGTNDASGEIFNLGLTTVTYTITDAAGNSSNCSFDVTINDTENPIISCPSNIAQVNDPGNCTAIVNSISPISSGDNCSVASITYNLSGATLASGVNDASGEIFNLGMTTVTYTITDVSGNSNNCSFDIRIIDTENPIILCVSDIFSCDSIVEWMTPTALDNCGISSITQIQGLSSGSDFPVGVTTIKYVATDNSNNTDTCTFLITVYPPSDASWSTPPALCQSSMNIDLSVLITGNTGGIFIGTGVNSPNFNPSVGAGNYQISYVEGVSGCEDTVINTITVLANPLSDAGNDNSICELVYSLNATAVNGVGTWSGNNVIFSPSTNDPNAVVTSSVYGPVTLYWNVDQSGICNVTDSVIIEFFETPIAFAGLDQNLNYLFTSTLSADLPMAGSGIWTSDVGTIADNTNPNSFVDNLLLGENIFTWTVTNGPCPAAIDEVIIFVNDIFIPQAITPNNDGANDLFVIEGIQFTDYNKLEIFNRWGQLEYSIENYRNDWYGINNDGKQLPADTYFYILNVNNQFNYNGYLVIRR